MKHFIIFFALLITIACEPETIPVSYDNKASQTKSIYFDIEKPQAFETKSSFPLDIENVFSGAILAIYDSSSGAFVRTETISPEQLNSSYRIYLPMDGVYDFYLLANLWKIDSRTSEAKMIDVPLTSSKMKDFVYRIDGRSIDENYRTERFDEVSSYGIPMCWSSLNVNSLTTGRLNVCLQRLFSKLVLTIDHSGISGTALEDFVNGSVYIKQINNKLCPFSTDGTMALDEGDIIPIGDAETSIENALVKELVFYIPENKQGNLLPLNTDPYRKNIETIDAVCGNTLQSKISTYLEFRGKISSSGISTNAIYRFFLGSDDTSNFDIGRNELYNVSLTFNAESLFVPQWKIETQNFSDTRQFFLSASLAGKLPDGKVIVVRKNRAAKVDLNMTLNNSSSNKIQELRLVDEGYKVENLRDLSWTSDFYSATHNYENEPQRSLLNDCGIDVSYLNGTFTFSVIDPSKFRLGESIPVTISLLPGNKKINAVIYTADDIIVREKEGKSLTQNFYIAQKRCLEIKGFYGDIYYAAIQDEVGHSSLGFYLKDNNQWKTSTSQDASFPRVAKNGEVIIYPYQNPDLYSSQRLNPGQDLDIYALWPNFFTNMNKSGIIKNSDGHIIVCSNDVLNDGIFDFDTRINLPVIDHLDGVENMSLTLDGYECQLKENYYHIWNNLFEPREEMTEDDFDPILFEKLLKPKFVIESESEWSECLNLDLDNKTVYFNRTTIAGRKIENELQTDAAVARIKCRENNATGLYLNRQFTHFIKVVMPFIKITADNPSLNYFNTTSTNSTISYTAKVYYNITYRPTNLEYDERGPKMKITMYNKEYEAVTQTNVTIPYNEAYSSVKAQIEYLYLESYQALTTGDSKGLIGGLLVPYGNHQFVVSLVNKWDGRRIEFTEDYDISYELELHQFAMYWEGRRYAGVLLVTLKNLGYVNRNFHLMDPEYQALILKVLGTNCWNSRVVYSNAYHYETAPASIPSQVMGVYQNFDVKYFEPSENVWTFNLMREATIRENYIWLDNLSFYTEEGKYEKSTTDPSICGHPSIKKITIVDTQRSYSRALTTDLGSMVN